MNTAALLIGLVFATGAVIPVQALINARLGAQIGGPIAASLVSFSVGTLVLLLVLLASRQPFPSLSGATSTSWWMWTGGMLGAVLVAMTTIAVPKLGAALLVALLVAGQMATSLALDHFGVLMPEARSISAVRVLGAVLIIAGVIMIQRG